jgi:cell division protein FtsB
MADLIADESLAAERAARRRSRDAFWSRVLAGAAVILLANGIFGERGLTETLRARRSYVASRADLDRLRRENAALREQAERLRYDASTIEAVARGELGLIRRGEILVTIRTLPQ